MHHCKNTSAEPQRIVTIDGVLNFRDLGGYQTEGGQQIAWGKVYRSAQLDRLSEHGVSALAELDIQVVVDLRFPDETHRYPTMRSAVPNAEMLAWQDFEQQGQTGAPHKIQRAWRESLASNDPLKVREAMRANYPSKLYSHRAVYREMLLRLIEAKTPLMFHCAAGKDRTGVAAALLLSLLGVDYQQIINDYLLTQQVVDQLMGAWNAGGATDAEDYKDFQGNLARQPRELIQPVFDADPAYIETLLDYVDATYGSFINYALDQLAMSEQQLETLRGNLLVPQS